MSRDLVLVPAPEELQNTSLTSITMPKSLPVNRLLGQAITMWGVYLLIRLSNPSLASQGQVSSMGAFLAWGVLQTLLLLSPQSPWARPSLSLDLSLSCPGHSATLLPVSTSASPHLSLSLFLPPIFPLLHPNYN